MSKVKSNPFFSIIIVNYNHGSFIEFTLLSIINQEFSDYEIILIDGLSTDNSLDVINKYLHRIDYFESSKDTGQSNAFNKALLHCKGEFLLWVNADDMIMPNSLKNAHDLIIKFPDINWFALNTVFINVNYSILWYSMGLPWNNWLVKKGIININGPSSIFRKKIIDAIGFMDEKLHYSMDTDLWLRFIKYGEKFKRLNIYFWVFRIHQHSKTSHTFYSEPNAKMIFEHEYLQTKNKIIFKSHYKYFVYLFKLVTMKYFISLLHTFYFKYFKRNNLKIESSIIGNN